MIKKFILYFLTISDIGFFRKYVQAEIDLKNTLTSAEFLNTDCPNLASQLKSLKVDNEFLKQRFGTMQFQMDKQKEASLDMDKKLDKITLTLNKLEARISMASNEYLNHLSDAINLQNQWLNTKFSAPAVDDKWEILSDIKDILKTHDNVLANLEKKLENVDSVLNKASWETPTRELSDNILNKLKVLQNIENKMSNIETAAATKELQIAFNRNLQKYISKNEVTKTCLKGENEKLICTSEPYPMSCADFNDKYCYHSKCRIVNHQLGAEPFLVPCDDEMEGGAWTIIQRRVNGSVDFYRNWSEYKNGFGDINGEFFIGMDKLNALTTTLRPVEILIQLQDFNETKKYAKYDEFHVGNETENYKLIKVGAYSGNAGDCFSQHQGYNFSTKDRDNDIAKTSCATYMKAAWWFGDCAWSNLNGMYYTTKTENKTFGIFWSLFHGIHYSLKSVQMSIRPKRL